MGKSIGLLNATDAKQNWAVFSTSVAIIETLVVAFPLQISNPMLLEFFPCLRYVIVLNRADETR